MSSIYISNISNQEFPGREQHAMSNSAFALKTHSANTNSMVPSFKVISIISILNFILLMMFV